MKRRTYVPCLLVLAAFSLSSAYAEHTPDPAAVTIVGNLQDELGCPGDWQPECAATHLAYDADNDVWRGTFSIPAGSWEYKGVLNDSWDENYGANAEADGPNIPLSFSGPTDVTFFYDHKSHWVTDNQNPIIATVPGSYQTAMGCPGDWDPSCLRTWLQDPDGDGIYSFATGAIPVGNYEAKVTHDQSWDENYGEDGLPNGPNIPFAVGANETITFEYDPVTHILVIATSEPVGPPIYAIIHYFRDDGVYGDHTTGNFIDFWGLHLWGDGVDAVDLTGWTSPKPFLGEDAYGRFAWVKLASDTTPVGFIVHRGDVKDGTTADRMFDPATTPEIWIRQDDPAVYVSQAAAQGFVTVRYHREDGDYGDPTSSDFNDFWGLHLWGDAIDPSEATSWTAPRKPDGFDDYGAFFTVLLRDVTQPVNFIVHRGDQKDPDGSPDRSFVPVETAAIWLRSEDVSVYPQRGAAEGFALIHYHRDGGDYGDPTSPDYNDFWGLHVWDGAASPNPGWTEPLRPDSLDTFGPSFRVDLTPGTTELAYIIHRGDVKDPGPDQALLLGTYGHEVWQLEGADPARPYILPVVREAEPNSPPNVSADAAAVTVDEGQTAANAGTVSDPDGDDVTIGASVGAVVNNGDGTWSWLFTTSDGPADSRTVTITADDGNGGSSQTAFVLTVDNLPPMINSVDNDSPILVGTAATIVVSAADVAGVSDPLSYAFDCDDDGVFEVGPQEQNVTVCSFNVVGGHTVHVKVTDDDGGEALASATVIVLTAQEAIEDFLVEEVEGLVDSGALNAGQGKALLSKLDAARAKLDQGNTTAARNLLSAFINQANGLIDGGVLTPEVGQLLIDAANGIIEALGG